MRMIQAICLLALLSLSICAAEAATGKVLKVLPHYLDKKGRHSVSPSLYDRDAYQAELRNNPELRGGMRFDINWTASEAKKANLKLRLELRTSKVPAGQVYVLEKPIKSGAWLGDWTTIRLEDSTFKEMGDLIAWRVILYAGDQPLSEQKSFLW